MAHQVIVIRDGTITEMRKNARRVSAGKLDI